MVGNSKEWRAVEFRDQLMTNIAKSLNREKILKKKFATTLEIMGRANLMKHANTLII